MFCTLVGTALDAANVRRAFRKVVADAGLNPADWMPRELRHSFVSKSREKHTREGINRLAAGEAVRHHALVTDWPYPVADGVPTPQTVAAWTRLGLLPTEKVPLWAAHWLVAGYDGEHLVYLAGLHGDDPHDVRDALLGALRDCGVEIPGSDVAAATVTFTDLARMYLNGLAGPLWVAQKVEEVLSRSGYPMSVMDLPWAACFALPKSGARAGAELLSN